MFSDALISNNLIVSTLAVGSHVRGIKQMLSCTKEDSLFLFNYNQIIKINNSFKCERIATTHNGAFTN